ncbi:hypothetical protein HYV57_06005 [Candidatus Peregrinibacteria bacterium]|nr:hypothetical protein [Candidatus Peregrinibacteria bacterium]
MSSGIELSSNGECSMESGVGPSMESGVGPSMKLELRPTVESGIASSPDFVYGQGANGEYSLAGDVLSERARDVRTRFDANIKPLRTHLDSDVTIARRELEAAWLAQVTAPTNYITQFQIAVMNASNNYKGENLRTEIETLFALYLEKITKFPQPDTHKSKPGGADGINAQRLLAAKNFMLREFQLPVKS